MTMATTYNPFLDMILNSDTSEEENKIVYMDYVRGPFVIQSVPHIQDGSDYLLDSRVQLRISALIKEAVSQDNYASTQYTITYK